MQVQKTVKRILSIVFRALAIALVLFPIIWLAISAFKHEKDIVSFPPRIFSSSYTLENFREVLDTFPFFLYLRNTALFAGSVMVTSVFLDSMSGYAFARMNFKGRNWLFAGVLILMMIPGQVLLIPQYLLVYKLGMLDTFWGLLVPRMTSAFGIFMMRSFFISLPESLEEAGRIDGLSEFGIFLRIMVPISIPGIVSLCIICFMANWNELLWPLIMTSSRNMRTLPAALATFVGERTASYGPAIAGAFMSMLPLVILYFCFQKYFIAGVAMSGSKE